MLKRPVGVPDKYPALVAATSVTVRLSRVWQGRHGIAERQEIRAESNAVCTCARYGADPTTSENAPWFEASGGGVVAPRKSDRMSYDEHHLTQNDIVPYRQRLLCASPYVGASTRVRVELADNFSPHLPTIDNTTLPKQCRMRYAQFIDES